MGSPIALVDGRFMLEAEIGRGGLGRVYQARDLDEGGRRVAVKLLINADPKQVRRFEREFRAIRQLRHPHVVAPIAFGQHECGPYIAMEYVQGRSLAVYLKPGAGGGRNGAGPPGAAAGGRWPRWRRVLGQLLGTLGDVHDQGLLHRDVKPSNVLVDERGDVRLLDFGLVKQLDFESEMLTTGDVRVGTLRYMAPELVEGRRGDRRSDLFSFGVIAFELLTGRLPYPTPRLAAVTEVYRRGLRHGPRRFDATIPPGVDDFLVRLLARDPAMRYPTAHEAIRALRDEGLLGDDDLPVIALAGTERPLCLPLLGREADLRAIARAAEGALYGGPVVVTVEGPGGIGKTALIEAALAAVRSIGYVTAGKPGRGFGAGGSGRFTGVDDDLLALLGRGVGRSGERQAPRDPHVATPEGPPGSVAPDPGALALEVAAVRGPVTIVLDDLAEATPRWVAWTRALFEALSRGTSATPVVVLAATRDGAGVRSVLGEGVRHVRVALGPLAARDLAALFEGPGPLPDEAVQAARRLLAETDGFPGRLGEVLDRWIDRRWIRRVPPGFHLATDLLGDDPGAPPGSGVPTASQETALRMQVEDLPDDLLEAAARIAVLGPRLEPEMAVDLLADSPEAVCGAFTALVDRGIVLEESTAGRGTVEFRVSRQAELLAERLASEVRRELHGRAARWLMVEEDGTGRSAALIAKHLEAAGDPVAASRYALAAARGARERHDPGEWLRLGEEAARLARFGAAPTLLCDALRVVCEACRALEQPDRGIAAARELGETARHAGDGDLEAEAGVMEGALLLARGRRTAAEGRLRQLVATVPTTVKAAAEARLRLAEALGRGPRRAEGDRLLEEAAWLFARSGDEEGVVRTQHARAGHAFQGGDFQLATLLYESLSGMPPGPRAGADVLERLGRCRMEVGDRREGLDLLRAAVEIRQREGDPAAVGAARAALAWASAVDGQPWDPDPDAAILAAREAGRQAERGWLLLARARSGGHLGTAASAAWDAVRAWRAFRHASQGEAASLARMTLARIVLALDPERAYHHARRTMDSLPDWMPPTLAWQFRARGAVIAQAAGRASLARIWAAEGRSIALSVLDHYLPRAPRRADLQDLLRRPRDLASFEDVVPFPAAVARVRQRDGASPAA